MTLDELQSGQAAVIALVQGTGALRHHLLDMGLTPRAEVSFVKRAPMGDPIQVKVRGYELTLRLDEARLLVVSDVRAAARQAEDALTRIEQEKQTLTQEAESLRTYIAAG